MVSQAVLSIQSVIDCEISAHVELNVAQHVATG